MSLTQKLKLSRRRSRGLVSTLLLAGVFPHRLSRTGFDVRKYAWTVFCIFSFSYLTVFTTYNLQHLKGHSFMVKVAAVKTSLSGLMCLVILLITMLKSDYLVDIIECVERNFYSYTDENRFHYTFSVSQRWEKVLMYGSGSLFVLTYSFAVLSHPLHLLFNRDLLRSGSKMLTHTWVPFKGDTIVSFYMAHALLFFVTAPVVLTITGNVCFSLHIHLEIRNQCERMGYVLGTLRQRIDSPFGMDNRNSPKTSHKMFDIDTDKNCCNNCHTFTSQQGKMFDNLLVECVQHYQSIQKCFIWFQNWFNPNYSIVLAHSVVALAMMSYGALLSIDNFGVSLKYVSILLVYTGQVFMYCKTAEYIYETNENLAIALFGVPWYRQPPKKRKIFYIFLCEVRRPFKLQGIKIYPASLNVFSSIMKLSYSYLNLLRTYGNSLRKS